MSANSEMQKMKEQIAMMQKEIQEYEAVEQYIVKQIEAGGRYEDILKAHYREGKLNDKGEWEDEDIDEDED